MLTRRTQKLCVCSGRTVTVMFRVKPKTLGRINLRVSAQTLDDNVCAPGDSFDGKMDFGDIVVRKLLVEAEGKNLCVCVCVCVEFGDIVQ